MSKAKEEQKAPSRTAGAKKSIQVAASKQTNALLEDIDVLAKQMELPGWEKAALFRAAGWSEGKQVSALAFVEAVNLFRARRMGTGRI